MRLPGRRRKFLIDALQIRLLTVQITYVMATVLLFVAILFGPPVLTTLDDSASVEARTRAADRMLMLHKSVWPGVIVLLVLFSGHSILTTHRIAGPLYRFRRVWRNLAAGDLRVRAGVRSRDYLGAEAAAINDMIDGLAARVRAIRQASEQVAGVSRKLDCLRAGGGGSEPLLEALESLRERAESLAGAVEGIHLPGDEAAPSPPRPAAVDKPEPELVSS